LLEAGPRIDMKKKKRRTPKQGGELATTVVRVQKKRIAASTPSGRGEGTSSAQKGGRSGVRDRFLTGRDGKKTAALSRRNKQKIHKGDAKGGGKVSHKEPNGGAQTVMRSVWASESSKPLRGERQTGGKETIGREEGSFFWQKHQVWGGAKPNKQT